VSAIQCAGEVHALAAATLAEVEDAAQTVAEKVARVHEILLPGSHAHDHAREAVERIVTNGLTRALRGETEVASR